MVKNEIMEIYILKKNFIAKFFIIIIVILINDFITIKGKGFAMFKFMSEYCNISTYNTFSYNKYIY